MNPDDRVEVMIFGTKGLIDVSLAEATRTVANLRVTSSDEKYAVLSIPATELPALANLRTVDDARWLLAGPQRVPTESEFHDFLKAAHGIALARLDRDQRTDPTWSVTMSARRPVWRERPTWSPREALRTVWNDADPDATQRSSIDIRLQVDGATMAAGLNFSEPGAWSRNKAVAQWRGALKSSVAAALIEIFDQHVDESLCRKGIYDPFCGSGTILAEAAARGIPVDGSDVESDAVELTRQRLASNRAGNPSPALFVHDVGYGFPASRVRAASIVTNAPWGKQVKIPRKTELFDAIGGLVAESHRRGGIAIVLTGDPEQMSARIRRMVPGVRISSRQIGMLGQTPTILTITKQA